MIPGPVFTLELLTTARRPRYYATRVAYGAAILFVISINFLSWRANRSAVYSPSQMAEFAAAIFGSFAALQGVVILAMTPALVSGVIADEKQRKTLHYLLTSRLSSGEIVLGKLAARMLHVLVFLVLGLPIVSLMSLFGGVDPLLVLVCEVVTASTAFFLASMSVLISTSARRVRDAIAAAYSLEMAWLFGPSLLRTLLISFWPALGQSLAEPLSWITATDPLGLLWQFGSVMRGSTGGLITSVAWMVALQLILGGSMVAVAIARLRPLFRAQSDGSPRRLFGLIGPRRKSGRWRMFARRPVGDDAMLWKELQTSRVGGLRQLAELILLTIVLGGLVIWAGTFAVPSFEEMYRSGYAMDQSGSGARWEFNLFVRISGPILCSLAALGTATAASNGMTMEREEDTWTALLSTPLGAREIVVAKMLGAVWRTKALLGTAAGLWLMGVVCGAVHPLGLIFEAIEVAVFVGFASALGTSFSLRSRTSWRSQTLTLGLLLFFNVGYYLCCCPVAMGMGGSGGLLMSAGCSPFIEGMSLLSPADLRLFGSPSHETSQIVAVCAIGVVGYLGAAAWLTGSTLRRFDEVVGRPHRGGVSLMSIEAMAAKPAGPKDPLA